MRIRLLSAAVTAVLFVISPTMVQAGDDGLSANTLASVDSLTKHQVRVAARNGTLDALLTKTFGAKLGARELASLESTLNALAATRPYAAARAAQALATLSTSLAATDPQAAMSQARIAAKIISSQGVIDAAPAMSGNTTLAIAEAARLAERYAESKGVTLSGAIRVSNITDRLSTNQTLLSVKPSLAQQILAARALADAKADLAGLTTGNGGGTGSQTGGGGQSGSGENEGGGGDTPNGNENTGGTASPTYPENGGSGGGGNGNGGGENA